MSKKSILAAAMVFLAVAAAVFFIILAKDFAKDLATGYLELSNAKTGELFARYELAPGDPFSIMFVHSVNKTPVTDFYDADMDGAIWLRKTVYYDFGAGVPFELNEGELLSWAEDNAMIITGMDRKLPNFLIFVGTISDHILTIKIKNNNQEQEREISLRDLCGRNAKVLITYTPPRLRYGK